MAKRDFSEIKTHYRHLEDYPGGVGRLLGAWGRALRHPLVWAPVPALLAMSAFFGPTAAATLGAPMIIAAGFSAVTLAVRTIVNYRETDLHTLREIDEARTVQKLADLIHKQSELETQIAALPGAAPRQSPVTRLGYKLTGWDIFAPYLPQDTLPKQLRQTEASIDQLLDPYSKSWRRFIRQNALDAIGLMRDPYLQERYTDRCRALEASPHDAAEAKAVKDLLNELYLVPRPFQVALAKNAYAQLLSEGNAHLRDTLEADYDTLITSARDLKAKSAELTHVEQQLKRDHTPGVLQRFHANPAVVSLRANQAALTSAIAALNQAVTTATKHVESETEPFPPYYADLVRKDAESRSKARHP